MLIYLCDLAYFHKWDNIQPIPLNVGYIAAYLKERHPEIVIEIFKEPQKILNRISEQPPDILAMSHYEWNSNLNLAVLKHMKQKNPSTITVMGGPSFQPYDSLWINEFFQKRPNLDAYITNEGEWSFNRFVELLQENDNKLLQIPFDELPSTVYCMDKNSDKVINNPKNFVKRLDLTNHPSPYLTGVLDDSLNDPHLAPVMETNRGCPYECTFCNWGNATKASINQFSLDTVKKEMEYIAKNTRNTKGFFYVGDANFGILKRDQKIADIINECSKKYDFPKHIYIYFAKNANDTIVNIASTLRSVTMMNLSRQTMNKDVLEYIKRDNISTEMFDDLQQKCYEKGIETFCELIYALPGETYQSFIDGVIETCNTGVDDIALFPHTMLLGAESSTRPYKEKYGLKTAYRVLPRYVNDDDDLPVLEYEEVVVETDCFSREDFWSVRLFQFVFVILKSEIFIELAYSLSTNGSNHAELANLIIKDKENWTPKVKKLFDDFKQSAKDEFLEENETKIEFTLEDIKLARKRNKALNPLYQSRIASNTELNSELKSYLLDVIDRFFANDSSKNLRELKQAMRFGFDKLTNYEKLESGKTISYEYDITSWLDDPEKSPLERFHVSEPITYNFEVDDDILLNLEKLNKISSDLTEIVYRLRANEMGPTGDRIFCYKRIELSDGTIDSQRISKREAIRHHVEIAARKS